MHKENECQTDMPCLRHQEALCNTRSGLCRTRCKGVPVLEDSREPILALGATPRALCAPPLAILHSEARGGREAREESLLHRLGEVLEGAGRVVHEDSVALALGAHFLHHVWS